MRFRLLLLLAGIAGIAGLLRLGFDFMKFIGDFRKNRKQKKVLKIAIRENILELIRTLGKADYMPRQLPIWTRQEMLELSGFLNAECVQALNEYYLTVIQYNSTFAVSYDPMSMFNRERELRERISSLTTKVLSCIT